MSYSQQQAKKQIDEAFKTFDKDNNGLLDAAEVRQLLESLCQGMGLPKIVSDDDVNGFIKEADTNGDGKLDKSECLQMFNKMNNH